MTRQSSTERTALRALRLACVSAIIAACGLVSTDAPAQSGPDDDGALAKTIVEKADDVRFPREGFEVEIAIDTTSADGTTEARKYRVLSKGGQNTIVMTLEPASDRGQAMLMKGHDLWVFLPSVSQPVRLSLAQRLTGQVANGDLARANLAGDYTPKIVRTEKVDGEPTYVLELNAVDRSVTYHRVVYWVRQNSYRPYKAEFYSLSDRLLKTCHYENYRQLAGRMRPARLIMKDALSEGETSVLEYSDMKAKNLPDKMFTKDYLKRVE